jgi:undecaprenyl-diphosphatase
MASGRETAPNRFGRRRADAWIAFVGLVVLVVCMLLVRDGKVGDAEESVFRAINDLPDFLKAPLWVGQLPGLLVTPLLAAVGFAYFRRYRLAAMAAALVPLKLFFERSVVKALVERERPIQTLTDVIVRDESSPGLSFPSGHAILAFGLAALLAPYLSRRWQIIVYAVALLNGFARVYLGAHNPLDIVGGAALGLAIGGGLNLLLGVPQRKPTGEQAG